MSGYNLKDIFEEFENNEIYVNLDETYFYTPNKNIKYKKENYIGYIESFISNQNEVDEIIESLKEEGSAIVKYNFKSLSKTIYNENIPIILRSIFNTFSYEP